MPDPSVADIIASETVRVFLRNYVTLFLGAFTGAVGLYYWAEYSDYRETVREEFKNTFGHDGEGYSAKEMKRRIKEYENFCR